MTITPPPLLPLDPTHNPRDLTDTPAWVIWRAEAVAGKVGKWTKIPYRATDPSRKASSTDPSPWSTFPAPYGPYQSDPSLHGIVYVLHDEGITGVDLDDAFAED